MVTEKYSAFAPVIQKMGAGVLGCLLSHLRAIYEAHRTGYNVAIVAEDDVNADFAPYWTSSIEQYAKTLPPGWQVVQLAYVAERPKQAKALLTFSKSTYWGTQAYMISRAGMDTILNEFHVGNGKFNLADLRHRCPKFTADGCLMGFVPDREVRSVSWKNGKRLLPLQYSATAQFFGQAMGNFHSTIGNESWRGPLTAQAVCAATADAMATFEVYCEQQQQQQQGKAAA